MLHPNPAINRLLWLLQLLLLAAAALLFYKVLFRPLLPLAAAFLLSGLIAKPVDRLSGRTKLPRGLCALLLTLAVVAALGLGGWLAGRLVAGQVEDFLAHLPEMLENLQESLSALQARLSRYFPGQKAVVLPDLQPPEIGLGELTDSLGWMASSLPDLLLTAVFILAATMLLTSRRASVMGFLKRQLPPGLLDAARKLRDYLKDALLGWVKAQGILAAVTFGLLLAGFLLLRVRAAVLLALAVAVMDALPVLGAGVVLIPWALLQLALGDYGKAAGLALLYAAVLAVRNALEPHVVGKQIGLDPLVSLISFYLGWRLAGLWGMVLGPVLVLVLVKLQEWGYSKLWR